MRLDHGRLHLLGVLKRLKRLVPIALPRGEQAENVLQHKIARKFLTRVREDRQSLLIVSFLHICLS